VAGEPSVVDPDLPPVATWRFVLSQLTTLRADAHGRSQDVLVTFDVGEVHVTDRAGRRRTWRLPEGLALVGGPAHVVLRADLGIAVYGPDGTQLPAAEEVAVIEARALVAGGGVEVFRLFAKGADGFRSISTPG
jgi:hypothetical protein